MKINSARDAINMQYSAKLKIYRLHEERRKAKFTYSLTETPLQNAGSLLVVMATRAEIGHLPGFVLWLADEKAQRGVVDDYVMTRV